MKVKVIARLMLVEERGVWELQEGSTVGTVMERLQAEHPELGEMKNMLVSLNGKRSGVTAPLTDGDELELILLMGGG